MTLVGFGKMRKSSKCASNIFIHVTCSGELGNISATSSSFSRNQQCRLFLSDTIRPCNSLSITYAYLVLDNIHVKGIDHRTKTILCMSLLVARYLPRSIVNVLPG